MTRALVIVASSLALLSFPALAQSTMSSGGMMGAGQNMQQGSSGTDMTMQGTSRMKSKRVSGKMHSKKMMQSKKMMRSQRSM